MRIAGGPGASSSARRALSGLERHLRDSLLDDVRLLTSELVTNSVRHGDVGPARDVELCATVSTGMVRVEVSDLGGGFEPSRAPTEPEDGGAGGWGLYLVDMVADRWGVDRQEGVTRVWFEIDRNSRARRAAL
jgi:anti-sigma regulatory factor (Ser/Thr protein kinase)